MNTSIVMPLFVIGLLALPTALGAAPLEGSTGNPPRLVFFGTYTGGESQGIYAAWLDSESGRLSTPVLAAKTVNPAFLAFHPRLDVLYAVNEVGQFEGRPGGAVSAFSIDPQTGRLTLLNQQSSRGAGPCHLSVDPAGKAVLVANYGGGSIAALPIQDRGSLDPAAAFVQHEGSSVNRHRQEAPHAHGFYVDAANRYLLVPDLGLDQVLVYRWNPNSLTLHPHPDGTAKVAPGAGPRHFTFHPNGRFGYLINELSNTITVFSYDPTLGRLAELQTVPTLPANFTGQNTTAEIVIHPSGRFLYGSNRGHDSIAWFAVNPDSGRLEPRGHASTLGRVPRSFAIDPTGRWLLAANQDSHEVVVFRIDQDTGQLAPANQTTRVPSPVCVLFKS